MRRLRGLFALGTVAVLASGCAAGDRPTLGEATADAAADATTTTAASDRWPPVGTDGTARVVVTSTGVVVTVAETLADGWRVVTPCDNKREISDGEVFTGAHVVIDPGHGGTEVGAVADDLTEADLNLAVALELERILEEEGLTVVLTRYADYKLPIESRTNIVNALKPLVFVSIHHNGGVAAQRSTPGTEVYYQVNDPSSRRLAGLVWEDVFAAFSAYGGPWRGGDDAGAIYRLGRDGSDFYGVLRRTAGVPSVLIEAAYLSHAREADLLARPDVQTAEAAAIARGILRYLTTDHPGSGYMEPNFRGYGSSGGGTFANCTDPKLS
ncbi:MAG TPA: N-acetylmuramoyl-L-alanine amidase [Acidimicrobiales bacterium]